MSYERNIRQIANVYSSISKFSENAPWKEKLITTQRDFLFNVATSLSIPPVELNKFLTEKDMITDVYGYIMEVLCSRRYENSGSEVFETLAWDFLQKNSWKLKTFQKAFLEELPNTLFSFWRVTKVTSNAVSLESYPFGNYQISSPDERLISNMKVGNILLTKFIKINNEVYPGAIITTLKKELADSIIIESHEKSIEFLNNSKKEAKEQSIDHELDDEFIKRIYVFNNLDFIIFKHWITDIYHESNNLNNS